MKSTSELLGKYQKKELEDTLMMNFKEARENPIFEKLVSQLRLPYEELSKYTTVLEDCALEYENCLKCKSLCACKNKVEGHAYLPDIQNRKLRFGYKPCKFMKNYQKKYAYLKNVYTLQEPNDIEMAQFADIDLKDEARLPVITYLTKFITDYREGKKGKGLYLHGSFGSGKTYLISATFHELAKDGVKSAIIFWPEYLTDLKTSFGTDEFKEKLDKVKKASLLLIDDIGAENTTAWSRDDVLCPILQYRMEEKLPTFFTSNFTLDDLEIHLSTRTSGYEVLKAKRIMERMKQLAPSLELSSKNLRN